MTGDESSNCISTVNITLLMMTQKKRTFSDIIIIITNVSTLL